jgi:hypothetical protein
MLDVRCSMLDVRCWMFDVGCSMLDVGCSMFDVGCWMFDVRCSMLDVGCSMFDVRCSMFDVPPFFRPPLSSIALTRRRINSFGLWRPFSRPAAWRPVHHSPALRNDGGSFTRPAAWPHGAALRGITAWPHGAALRGQPDFSFPPVSFVLSFWSKKWLNPFKKGSFCVSETVQKKFKKKLTPSCCFEIL